MRARGFDDLVVQSAGVRKIAVCHACLRPREKYCHCIQHIFLYIYILFLLRYYVDACWVSDPAPKSINSKSALPATVGVNDKGLGGWGGTASAFGMMSLEWGHVGWIVGAF